MAQKKWKNKKSDGVEQAGHDKKLLAKISELSTPAERKAELRWYADQGEDTQLEITTRRDIIYRQKREDGEPTSTELSHGSLLLSIKIVHREQKVLSMKEALDPATAGDVSRRKMDKFKSRRQVQRSPKYEKIRVQFFVMITRMKEENFSWQDIRDFLHQEHNFPCTRAYLYNSYMKAKKEFDAGQDTTATEGEA